MSKLSRVHFCRFLFTKLLVFQLMVTCTRTEPIIYCERLLLEYMQTRVYYNQHSATLTRTRVNVNPKSHWTWTSCHQIQLQLGAIINIYLLQCTASNRSVTHCIYRNASLRSIKQQQHATTQNDRRWLYSGEQRLLADWSTKPQHQRQTKHHLCDRPNAN